MIFKIKAYNKSIEWKDKPRGRTAMLLKELGVLENQL